MTLTTMPVSRAPRPSSLADVLDVILDKGIVIDLYVRVSLIGIEILTIDARLVIASVDTYLRFAEAVNRLDLQPQGQVTGLPGMLEGVTEGGAKSKTKGALTGAKEKAGEFIGSLRGGSDDDDEDEDDDERVESNGNRRRESDGRRGGSDGKRRAPEERRAPQGRRRSDD
jgi:gas vesicle structural protein